MAAVARLSVYHFARQFKAATGLPPHQNVIARRVERAKQLLQGGGDLSLAEVAAHTGFCSTWWATPSSSPTKGRWSYGSKPPATPRRPRARPGRARSGCASRRA